MSDRPKRRMRIGVVLVLVGLAFFLRPRFDFLDSEYVLLLLGVVFLGAYLWQRRYRLMVPAGVLMGLGVGRLFDENLASFAEGSQLGLGLGFLAIYLVPLVYQRKSHWWPLIPGGVLIASAFEDTEKLARVLFDHWPLALVAVGAVLIVAGWLDRERSVPG